MVLMELMSGSLVILTGSNYWQIKNKKTRSITLQGLKNNIFSHPDYTVGSRIELDQPFGSRAIPPVGTRTLP
jgi:hypothetical protein